jgi:hypothetical protein
MAEIETDEMVLVVWFTILAKNNIVTNSNNGDRNSFILDS